MASSFGSWLSGPPPADAGGPGAGANDYPGHRLGLPEQGPGSIARFGRRVGALVIDWLISYGLAGLAMSLGWISIGTLSTAVLAIWLLLGVASVRLFGFTPGQLALGLMVVPVDGSGQVGLGKALVRGVLTAFVIPALFTDTDHRGIHDLASKTAVILRR